eukprot:Phypoly_transcript_07618.p1 GENE.Phypoly_transcript_07618~~Phypoly_transcript_07618.p1  ORF type:complete len:443 (+),score=33.17 Phypoly_transcript_07618:147-1475(+)
MEGWLLQYVSDGTEHKYFKLQGSKLLFYNSKPPDIEDNLAIQGALDLPGHAILSVSADLPYSFSICTVKPKEVVLTLAAANQKEMDDWVSALTAACQTSETNHAHEESLKSVEYDIELTSTGITETETEELLQPSSIEGDLSQTTITKQTTIVHTFKKFLPEIRRVFGFIFMYLFFIIPVVYFSDKIPSTVMVTDPNWKDNDVIYDDWLQSFPWSTLVIWCITLILGFIYVANVTESRKNPFANQGRYVTFTKFLVALPIVFVFGPARTLFEPEEVNNPTKQFLANYFGFTIPFFIGLQFTYLDHILFLRYMGDKFGTPSLWKTYTFKELSVMIPIVLAISAAVFWHVYLVITSKLIVIYAIFYSIVATFFLLPTYLLRKTHYLHVHHYAIFGSLIPLAAFPNIFSMICLGLLSGIYVEGISRWSMGWFWYRGERRLNIITK